MNIWSPLYELSWSDPLAVGIFITLAGATVLTCGYMGLPFFVWVVLFAIGLGVLGIPLVVIVIFLMAGVTLSLPPVRQIFITKIVMKVMKSILPRISTTERVALEAGVVGAESELFSGKPDFTKLMEAPYPKFTEEEQAFLDGPVVEVCELINDWVFWKNRALSDEVMEKLKSHGFFGMIIPKKYGGLGFSAYVHSEVILRLGTQSSSLAVTVMVPNSLGPAELLMEFGTESQKKHYLPRLATGEEMPCFGLTEPQAGSDASAIRSEAVLFRGKDGEIYMRINWRKRWITLAAISTVVGLAFKLRDPDNLLGRGEENLGITCGLIPSNTKGVILGRRHDPLGCPFYNCPIEGHDVIVKAEDSIIGGLDKAGDGWRMLMECLGVGRGISLPALSTGGIKLLARVTSNHASIRKQFGVAIGRFEGVEEPLARIGGKAYLQEALRLYTIGAIQQGIKPPVVTAMTKYMSTELLRSSVNEALDIMGGAGISLGPRNLVAPVYFIAPVGITVEGANILTRTLMIFGQGALKAHPYAFKEMKAVEEGDLKAFDRAFWGHIGHIHRNLFRCIVLSVTRGCFASPGYGEGTGRYFQKLSWMSSAYAIMADIAMVTLGGKLKTKEKLTGRYADILMWMYAAVAILKKFKEEGCRPEDRPFFHYSMQMAFSEIQKSFDGILANFNVPVVGWFFKGPIRWWSFLNVVMAPPSDELSQSVAQLIQTPSQARDRLTHGVYFPRDEKKSLARLEKAFAFIKKAEGAERKVRRAIRKKQLPKAKRVIFVVEEALEKNIISHEEAEMIKESADLRWDAIQVDDFSEDEYRGTVDL